MSANTLESIVEFWDRRRSSEVTTLPRSMVSAQSSLTFASGSAYGALAHARTAGTYTQIRFATGTAPSSLTDIRVGVWNAAGTSLLAETANEVATVTGASTVYTLALSSGVALTQGQAVVLGLGFVGTSMQVRGITVLGDILALTPRLNFRGSGFTTGGSLPSDVTVAGGSGLPWVELVP